MSSINAAAAYQRVNTLLGNASSSSSRGQENQQATSAQTINNFPNNSLNIATDSNGSTAGANFIDLVRGATTKTIEQNYQAEQLAARGVLGEADLTEVVLAVSNAESSLRTIVAVRDRMVPSLSRNYADAYLRSFFVYRHHIRMFKG